MRSLCISMILLASCGNPVVKEIKGDAIACGSAQVSSVAVALLPSVVQLLGGKAPNWKGDLNVILDSLGAAAACSVQAAVKAAEDKVTNVDVASAAPTPAIIKNGRAVMAERHLRFVTVDDEVPPSR